MSTSETEGDVAGEPTTDKLPDDDPTTIMLPDSGPSDADPRDDEVVLEDNSGNEVAQLTMGEASSPADEPGDDQSNMGTTVTSSEINLLRCSDCTKDTLCPLHKACPDCSHDKLCFVHVDKLEQQRGQSAYDDGFNPIKDQDFSIQGGVYHDDLCVFNSDGKLVRSDTPDVLIQDETKLVGKQDEYNYIVKDSQPFSEDLEQTPLWGNRQRPRKTEGDAREDGPKAGSDSEESELKDPLAYARKMNAENPLPSRWQRLRARFGEINSAHWKISRSKTIDLIIIVVIGAALLLGCGYGVYILSNTDTPPTPSDKSQGEDSGQVEETADQNVPPLPDLTAVDIHVDEVPKNRQDLSTAQLKKRIKKGKHVGVPVTITCRPRFTTDLEWTNRDKFPVFAKLIDASKVQQPGNRVIEIGRLLPNGEAVDNNTLGVVKLEKFKDGYRAVVPILCWEMDFFGPYFKGCKSTLYVALEDVEDPK